MNIDNPKTTKPFYQDPSEYVSLEDYQVAIAYQRTQQQADHEFQLTGEYHADVQVLMLQVIELRLNSLYAPVYQIQYMGGGWSDVDDEFMLKSEWHNYRARIVYNKL